MVTSFLFSDLTMRNKEYRGPIAKRSDIENIFNSELVSSMGLPATKVTIS